jgi:Nif-specific regulatory protein
MENCLERAAILTEEGVIDPDLIRFVQMRDRSAARVSLKVGVTEGNPRGTGGTAPVSTEPSVAQTSSTNSPDIPLDERGRVIAALEQAGWVQARAARLLGITPRQIAYRIQTLNIEVKQL